jgi:hypothetical protein
LVRCVGNRESSRDCRRLKILMVTSSNACSTQLLSVAVEDRALRLRSCSCICKVCCVAGKLKAAACGLKCHLCHSVASLAAVKRPGRHVESQQYKQGVLLHMCTASITWPELHV